MFYSIHYSVYRAYSDTLDMWIYSYVSFSIIKGLTDILWGYILWLSGAHFTNMV